MLLSFLACTPLDPVTAPLPTDVPVPTPAPQPTGSPTPTDDPLQPLLDGSVAPADFVHQVAWEQGWPLDHGDGRYSFVALGSDVQLAGAFDDWTPRAMQCQPGFCWATVQIDQPAGQGYKFVRGDAYEADPAARSFTWDAFGRLSFVEPPAGAHFQHWPQATGAGELPRDLTVHVPGSAGPYRVLYAHDGQNLFDPGGPFGSWRLQDVAGDVLIVGIHNTSARFDDYTHAPDDIGSGPVGGAGDAYADFVHGVVRPHIEATYGSTGIDGQLGSSLGGLIAMHIAQRHPGQYDFVASLSGTLGWGRFGDLSAPIEEAWLAADPGGVLFLSSGGGPGADGVCTDPDGDGYAEDDPDSSDNYCENRWAADRLGASTRTWDVDLFHWYDPDAPHNEAAWRAIAHRPLTLFQEL